MAEVKDYLDEMFIMQEKILKHYITIEGLPPYPVDLSLKSGQKIIKNFTHRMIEELSEGYEKLEIALEAVSTNNQEKARQYIAEYNEELADAMHFLLEILIYCDIDAYFFDSHLEAVFEKLNMPNLWVRNRPLTNLFRLGNFINTQERTYINPTMEFTIYNKVEVSEFPELSGAKKLSRLGLVRHTEFLWHVTHRFNQALNLLDNRDWHQKQRTDDFSRRAFYEKLTDGIGILFQYLDFSGQTELGIFKAYKLKNEINQKRITNGY